MSGGSPAGTRSPRYSTPTRYAVERLAAVVELDLEVREVDLDVLADPLGVLGRGVGADEHGDDLAVVVDELAEQLAHRVGRRARGRDDAVARQRDPVALA